MARRGRGGVRVLKASARNLAILLGQTLLQYQGDHPVADEYRTLAKEFEDRLTALRQSPPIRLTEEVLHA